MYAKPRGAPEFEPSIGGGGGGRRYTPAELQTVKPEPYSSDTASGAVEAKDKRKSRFSETRAIPVANGAGVGVTGNEPEEARARVGAAVGGVNFSSSHGGFKGKGKGKAKEARAGGETGGPRRRVPEQR